MNNKIVRIIFTGNDVVRSFCEDYQKASVDLANKINVKKEVVPNAKYKITMSVSLKKLNEGKDI